MMRSSAGAGSAQNETSRLFRHDRLVVWNTIRATFSRWHDRVIAALMLLAALAVVRTWFADCPWTVAAWAALAAATLIARPALLVVSVAAYLAGALIADLTSGVSMPRRIVGTTRPGWTIRAWSHRPIAGVAAAMVLLLSLLPARALGMDALMAVLGIETSLLALMLTSIEHAIVRFMAILGHGSRGIIVRHAKGLGCFVAVAVPGCWIMFGPVASGIVAAAAVAMLLLLTLRILAYRLHAKRFADLIVPILAGLLMLVAYSLPVALPVIALVMLWQMERRGRAKTWLLA